jgi:hypothetical protein
MNNTLDWEVLEQFIKDRNPVEVSAGLLNDWFWTAATVYEDGEWKDKDEAYVTSYWAMPGFKATMRNGDVIEVVASKEQTEEERKMHKEKSEKTRKELHELAESLESGKL